MKESKQLLKIEKKVKFIKGDKSFFEREPLQKISKLKNGNVLSFPK